MRVLIIGCGYVGLPLGAELARRGHEVFGVRRSPAAENEMKCAGIKPIFADVTEPEELKKLPREIEWIVNCVASSGGDAEDYRRVYLQGARNLVGRLASNPPAKFISTGSTSVYGQTDGSLVDETSPAEPQAETARVLLETEKFLIEAAQERKFPAILLRIAGIYGPGRGRRFKQFLRGEAKIEGDGQRVLNMIHRDDVVGAIIAALERGRPGEIYNATDDEPVRQLEFFQWLANALGKPMPSFAPENPEKIRKRGATDKRVSNRKLRIELGYQFKYPTFREGYMAQLAK